MQLDDLNGMQFKKLICPLKSLVLYIFKIVIDNRCGFYVLLALRYQIVALYKTQYLQADLYYVSF